MNVPPKNDQIEISVFGPGYGECILIHAGDNEWIIVDSCIDSVSREPAAMQYLKGIGVNSNEAVKFIIASHWHDDHIRGMSSIVNSCQNAKFVCPSAMLSEEFFAVVRAYGAKPLMTSGINEFYQVILSLEKDRRPVKYASEGKCLWKKDSSSGLSYEIYSLSPSDASMRLANIDVSKSLFPTEKGSKRDIRPLNPNHFATVIWMNIGDISILLGSDLENTSLDATGWSAIINSPVRPNKIASIFKIPHHGSENADNPMTWSEMLIKQPYAVITPFCRGKVRLPKESDILRTTQQTDKGYITSNADLKRFKKSKVVEEFIKGAVESIHQVNTPCGQVRLRSVFSNTSMGWHVDLFNSAAPLKTLQ